MAMCSCRSCGKPAIARDKAKGDYDHEEQEATTHPSGDIHLEAEVRKHGKKGYKWNWQRTTKKRMGKAKRRMAMRRERKGRWGDIVSETRM